MTTSLANNSVFRGFFEKQKLIGPIFIDWYRQLRIVLSIEDKLNYLEQSTPPAPVAPADSVCLESRAGASSDYERFHSCRQEEGQSVSSYILKMKGYIDNLGRLRHHVKLGLGVSLILIGLRKEYDGFLQNYNMHSMGKTVNELHAMLKLHEQTLPKNNAPDLNAIRAGNPKRKNAASGAGGSGIFVIELNTILNRSWIYDTGCGTHICNTTHGLRASRKLKPGALSLYMGNGQCEAVEAIGAFYLCKYGELWSKVEGNRGARGVTSPSYNLEAKGGDGACKHCQICTIFLVVSWIISGLDDMPHSCPIEYPKHPVMIARVWM
uniref:Zinc finger, CCHC-type n=1 Tax=Tanacetum cinerariifolium TaxID=118510 RepID=A0A6L2N0E6_TANCI|nr:hypothetical protein [Tanacetum cinerariifolium]